MTEIQTQKDMALELAPDPAERRQHLRIARPRLATIWTLNGEEIASGDVINMSSGGAKLMMAEEAQLPPRFLVAMNRFEGQDIPRVRCSLQWQRGKKFGVSFY